MDNAYFTKKRVVLTLSELKQLYSLICMHGGVFECELRDKLHEAIRELEVKR